MANLERQKLLGQDYYLRRLINFLDMWQSFQISYFQSIIQKINVQTPRVDILSQNCKSFKSILNKKISLNSVSYLLALSKDDHN